MEQETALTYPVTKVDWLRMIHHFLTSYRHYGFTENEVKNFVSVYFSAYGWTAPKQEREAKK